MPDVSFFTAPGQPSFSDEVRVGDFAIAFPLAPGEPNALEITAPYWQLANSYTKPAANTNMAWGSDTAYFDDDVDFRDEGGGVQSWTRRWLTKPNSWSEPGGTYAFTFPAYTSALAFGTIFAVTGIAVDNSNVVLNTNATGISVGQGVLLDLSYNRDSADYHITTVEEVVGVSSGVSLTISPVLPGAGPFSSVSGVVRRFSPGRDAPTPQEVDSWLRHDYAISDEIAIDADLPQVGRFTAFDSVGNETLFLTAGNSTWPSANNYSSMVANGQFIVAATSERRRYSGPIYERITRLIKAH